MRLVGVRGILGGTGVTGGLLTLIADLGDDTSDVNGVVLFGQDLQQHAGHRGGDLGVDLVGGDLQQRFVDLDGVADLLQPLGDSAFSDGFAQFGHFDGVRHGVEAPKKRCTDVEYKNGL